MLIETHDLRKTYHMGTEEVHALRGVDLHIRHGEFIAIIWAPRGLENRP